MIISKMKWELLAVDDSLIATHCTEFGLSELLARILVHRGITSNEQLAKYLEPDLDQLYDPYLLKGLDVAVERIKYAVETGEKVAIYGDYDVDGITSVSLLLKLFRQLGGIAEYYIPNRLREGYGLNKPALDSLHKQGVTLVITVDNGISSVDEADFAEELGIDLIITDHHQPGEVLPSAYAIINPHQPGCEYPCKKLAGVGIAFKLATALLERVPVEFLDLVALGTIADLAPLVDENRVFVTYGLQQLNLGDNKGIASLQKITGLKGKVLAEHVGFGLGPRINASGRLGDAGLGVRLLTTDDADEAAAYALELNELNQLRKQLVDDIYDSAVMQIESEGLAKQAAIVVAEEGWHLGVIGIVASRLVDKYYRPVAVLGIDPESGIATGSARSIAGFDLHQALTDCQELFMHFGGHFMAAGMSLSRDKIATFKERFAQLAASKLTEQDYVRCQDIDATLSVAEIDRELLMDLERLEPYGVGNAAPVLLIADTTAVQVRAIGAQKQYLQLKLAQSGANLQAVDFRGIINAADFSAEAELQLIGELKLNEWAGRSTPQLFIRDINVAHCQIFDWRGSELQRRQKLARLTGIDDICYVVSDEIYEAAQDPQTSANEAWSMFEPICDSDNMSELMQRICLKRWQDIGPDILADTTRVCFMSPPPALDALATALKQLTKVEALYFCYGEEAFNEVLPKTPTRQEFKLCYSALQDKEKFSLTRHLDSLMQLTLCSRRTLSFIIKVFAELEFVEIRDDMVYRNHNHQRRELATSNHYIKQLAQQEVLSILFYSSQRELVSYVREHLIQSKELVGVTAD